MFRDTSRRRARFVASQIGKPPPKHIAATLAAEAEAEAEAYKEASIKSTRKEVISALENLLRSFAFYSKEDYISINPHPYVTLLLEHFAPGYDFDDRELEALMITERVRETLPPQIERFFNFLNYMEIESLDEIQELNSSSPEISSGHFEVADKYSEQDPNLCIVGKFFRYLTQNIEILYEVRGAADEVTLFDLSNGILQQLIEAKHRLLDYFEASASPGSSPTGP